MNQLEKRFYSRTELADITGRNPASGHFARDVRDDLTKWGYGFNWQHRRGATITRIPTTAKERLAEIMIRQFGLDIQVDVYAFACFLYLILTMEEFACMPWAEREVEIWQQFEISIAESTLRRWASRLLEGDNLLADEFPHDLRDGCVCPLGVLHKDFLFALRQTDSNGRHKKTTSFHPFMKKTAEGLLNFVQQSPKDNRTLYFLPRLAFGEMLTPSYGDDGAGTMCYNCGITDCGV